MLLLLTYCIWYYQFHVEQLPQLDKAVQTLQNKVEYEFNDI